MRIITLDVCADFTSTRACPLHKIAFSLIRRSFCIRLPS